MALVIPHDNVPRFLFSIRHPGDPSGGVRDRGDAMTLSTEISIRKKDEGGVTAYTCGQEYQRLQRKI